MTTPITYWTISNGPRGCYMADYMWTARASSRRELKSALMHNDPWDGAPSKRAIASLAAAAWRARNDKRFTLPMCAPYRNNAGYGLFVQPADRDEWRASQEDHS